MDKKITFTVFSLFLLAPLLAAPSRYEEIENPPCGFSGTEKCVGYKKDTTTCFITSRYIVWAEQGKYKDSTQFKMDPLEPQERSPEDLETLCEAGPKNEKPVFNGIFSGTVDRFAFGDHGTNLRIHGLSVYDIETGKKLLYTHYQSGKDFIRIDNKEVLSFWRPDEHFTIKKESRSACKDSNGVSGFMNHRIQFNFKTGKESKTKDAQCFSEEK